MLSEINAIINNRVKRAYGKNSLLRLDMSVTMNCNSHCAYCLIWKNNLKNELSLEDFRSFFKNLSVNWLHLTGGEPFLRKDFSDIVVSAQEIKGLLVVDTSTNGFLHDRVISQCEKMLSFLNSRFEVGVSIDGISEVNDESRGVNGGFEKALKTYFSLKGLFSRSKKADTHINHFISPMNLTSFPKFLDTMEGMGINASDISVDVFRVNDYFKNNPEKFDTDIIIDNLKLYLSRLKGNNYRLVLRKLFTKHLIDFLKAGKRMPCSASRSSLHIDSFGNVFPCQTLLSKPLFNIRDTNNLLEHPIISAWRKGNDCRICFSGCEGVSSIIHNFPRLK